MGSGVEMGEKIGSSPLGSERERGLMENQQEHLTELTCDPIGEEVSTASLAHFRSSPVCDRQKAL